MAPSSPSLAATRSGSLVQMMRRHPLFSYFLIAFACTWVYEVIAFGFFFPDGELESFLAGGILTLVGPTLSAFITTAIMQGRPGLHRLLHRYMLWRVNLRWYLFTLLAIPMLLLLGYLVIPGVSAAFQTMPVPVFFQSYVLSFVSIFIVGGPFGEEPGWRGFALPRLQQKYGPLVGTLILGAVWGLWHLPLMILLPGYNGAGTEFIDILLPFLAFVVEAMALAIIITWVFNNARGSLLVTMLLHASFNTSGNTIPLFFPTLPSSFSVQVPILVAVGAALLIILVTRGHLSYQSYQQHAELLDLPLSIEQSTKVVATLANT